MMRMFITLLLPIIILGLLLMADDACRKGNAETAPPTVAWSRARQLHTTTLNISGETFTIELAYRQADRIIS
jgi:hypothetical protein